MGLGGHTSGAPQLVAVVGVAGELPYIRVATSGVRGLNEENGVSGQTDGAPQLVAVVGVFGTETYLLAAMSGVMMYAIIGGDGGQTDGAPQEVAVVGVGGESSRRRAAISGEGYRETLDIAGVASESSGPKDVATDGVRATEPAIRPCRSTERIGRSKAGVAHCDGGPADEIAHS